MLNETNLNLQVSEEAVAGALRERGDSVRSKFNRSKLKGILAREVAGSGVTPMQLSTSRNGAEPAYDPDKEFSWLEERLAFVSALDAMKYIVE